MDAQQIKFGKTLWTEDDATYRDPDHDSFIRAYRRITGETFDAMAAIAKDDQGDGCWYQMPNGYVVYASYPGNSAIYSSTKYPPKDSPMTREKITPANLLQKLRLHDKSETPAVCFIAGQQIERLTKLVKNLRTASLNLRGCIADVSSEPLDEIASRCTADAFQYDDEAQALLADFGIATNEQEFE